jgi:carboxymethylenebutenolidase
MRFVLCLLLALASVGAFAQEWAKKRLEDSPRHQEWIELKSGARTLKCFVVYPERKDKAPVVLVIHEIFGLSDWALSVADQLAEHGYIAIAPDFLSGAGPNGGRTTSFPDVPSAREAVSGLPPSQVLADLDAAADYVKQIPSANGKTYVAGFCWGGSKSFEFATHRPNLSGAFVFYGTPPEDPVKLKQIHCPVYGFYGGNDNRVTSTVPGAEAAMKAAGKKYEPVIYDGAGHGFMRAGEQPNPDEENKKAHDQAWTRWLAVLAAGH